MNNVFASSDTRVQDNLNEIWKVETLANVGCDTVLMALEDSK